MARELQPTMKPWKYEDSVAVGKKLVGLHRKVTLDLVRELYAARQTLAVRGARTDLGEIGTEFLSTESTSRQNVGRLSPWQQYCHDIGITDRTAQRYLSTYLPEEDRLLTEEEIQERKEEAKSKLIAMFKEVRSHVGNENWRPEGWTPAIELKYQEWLRYQKLLEQEPDHSASWSQLGLFAPEYLDAIGRRIQTKTSGMGLVEFNTKCVAAQKIACDKVPIREQMRVCMIVEAALEDFQPSVRAEVARFVSQQLMLDTTDQ